MIQMNFPHYDNLVFKLDNIKKIDLFICNK